MKLKEKYEQNIISIEKKEKEMKKEVEQLKGQIGHLEKKI